MGVKKIAFNFWKRIEVYLLKLKCRAMETWSRIYINDAEVQIERTIGADVPEEIMPNNAFYLDYQHFLLLQKKARKV